jgi:hypothetical protein
MADRAGFHMRRDHDHFAHPGQRGGQGMDAVGVDAIVVRNQDSFHLECQDSAGEYRIDYTVRPLASRRPRVQKRTG